MRGFNKTDLVPGRLDLELNQVGPLIPAALAVGTRKKRVAINVEEPPAN